MVGSRNMDSLPASADIKITNCSAKIKLQALMDLTARRLISYVETNYSLDSNEQLILNSQWGFDRSSSQSLYHRKKRIGGRANMFHNFMISVVPLRLISNGVIIWKNERPTSTSFCRPILFKFMKDTKENVEAVLAPIEAEIDALTPTTISDGVTVTHQMMMTMIDDEYLPITSETIASVCKICEAEAKKVNPVFQTVKWKQAEKNEYKHGLSTLHVLIRSMDSLLEICYKVGLDLYVDPLCDKFPSPIWLPKNLFARKAVKNKKRLVQEVLKYSQFLLDPSDQNYSSISRGTSSRLFFERTPFISALSKLDKKLLKQIAVVLQCISSGRKILIPKFRQFCIDTARRYMELYPWYHMPSPLHKLLIHGPDFVENFSIIPIGLLCEEINESKDIAYRGCREVEQAFHSHKWNRKTFKKLLLKSDPVLASTKPKIRNSSYFRELYKLTESEDTDDISMVDE